MRKVEFYRHNISTIDIAVVNKVLKSLYLTTGKYTAEFEQKFAKYLGCKEVVGTTSCTAALHISLVALGVGPGDEVITTPLSFFATSNAVLYTGATPVFVDIEPSTGLIDPVLIEKAITKKTKAIVPVHMYGQMCDMKAIHKIAKKYGLKIVEDSALCVEGKRDGVRPGQLSDAACFSFHAIKSISCGEGGAIAVQDKKIAQELRLLRLHGMGKSFLERSEDKFKKQDMLILGYKCNMYDLQAALLVKQMNKLNELWGRKKQVDKAYRKAFADNKFIKMPRMMENSRSALNLFTIFVNPEKRDVYLAKLSDLGIGVDVKYRCIHLSTYYKRSFNYKKGDFPQAELLSDSTITLPFYAKLLPREVEYVIKSINNVVME